MGSDNKIALHCYKRAKERTGMNRKRTERMADLAKERGITFLECKRAADRKYLQHRTKGNTVAIAYNGCCFIMDKKDSECVTMYKLPKWFGKRKTLSRKKDDDQDWGYALDA